MPSAIDTVASAHSTMAGPASDRKRHRDDTAEDTPRRPKKTKDLPRPQDDEAATSPKKPKKAKKSDDDDADVKPRKEKHRKRDKADKKDRTAVDDAANGAADTPPAFPFFTQTVSLWVPLYPVGFDRPLTSAAHQHLDGLVNHYSPLLGGYLLAYRNVNLADKAARPDPAHPPTDATPATLASVDEYAVGFGWLTADVDLFVPRRGAWLEGRVVLQNEGALGVSCWDKFNASIEAARLPAGWQYVEGGAEQAGSEAPPPKGAEDGEDAADDDTPDADALPDLRASGYWVDADGLPVTGTVRFRIKEFDVGLAGDNGYLAIEGTMLDADDERRLLLQERARKRSRIDRLGGKLVRRPLPAFSITQFGKEEEEEDSGQRVEVYKGSRPGTPDD